MKPCISYMKLKMFYYVVTENGFKKAAAKLFVTEGAVSQQIKDLEVRLGKRLLERSTNRKVETDERRPQPVQSCGPFYRKIREYHG